MDPNEDKLDKISDVVLDCYRELVDSVTALKMINDIINPEITFEDIKKSQESIEKTNFITTP